jgi:hypothetical protein
LCQNVCLSVLSLIGGKGKSTVGWWRQTCCFWSKNTWWKRKCEAVRCRDVTASSFVAKVLGEVFAHFHSVAVKRHSSMRNWLFGLWGRILCEQFLDVKENDEHTLAFALFLSLWFLDFLGMAHVFSLERLSNLCQGLRRTFSEICTKCDAVPLPDPSRNDVRSDTRLQIKVFKKSARPPSCVKCTSTVSCRCIALLHLLYRWQLQFRKLWIPRRA